MQVVGHFVGIGADERALDLVHRTIERVQRHVAELGRECLLKQRIEMLPEAAAAADEVLPQTGLALVHAGRGAVRERCALERAVDAQLVERVPALVQCREQRVGDLVFAHPGRDAHIAK